MIMSLKSDYTLRRELEMGGKDFSAPLYSFEHLVEGMLLHVAADLNDAAQNVSHIHEMFPFQTFRAQRSVDVSPT
jgi:hypothetical protein